MWGKDYLPNRTHLTAKYNAIISCINDRHPEALLSAIGSVLFSRQTRSAICLFVKGWPSFASPPLVHNHSAVDSENGSL